MFRTEVVKSKNLKKSPLYKVFTVLVALFVLFILAMSLNIIGGETGSWIEENYTEKIRPFFLVMAVILFIFSVIVSNSIKSPKRLGTIEVDDENIKYLENDEVKITHNLSDIKSIDFEFFSVRMRGNPSGCTNYLTLKKDNENVTYEIVVNNMMEKTSLGEHLAKINTNVPVTVRYSYFLKKLVKDKDFKF